jgi:histone deacetylase complex regulatory component SIN3
MDAIALGALATTAVSVVLPYLGKAGEAFSEKAGEKLFEFLKSRFEKKPAAAEALGELERAPQDSARQQAVQAHVQDLLTEEPTALKQLQELLAEIRSRQAPAVAIQQNAGDNAKQLGQVIGNVSFGKD